MPENDRKFGTFCVFSTRSCGTLSAIIILLCGFITIIPLPSTLAGSITRCIPTGLLLILSAVSMFFMEATVLGYCFDRVSFLVAVSKYLTNWIRFVVYLVFSTIPILLWCISASTIICLGLFFLVAALNFMLAIGLKGDHSDARARMTLSVLKAESGDESEGLTDTKEAET